MMHDLRLKPRPDQIETRCEELGTRRIIHKDDMIYPVVTLCGSTKFKDDFERVYRELSFKGYLVFTVACFSHADKPYDSGVMTQELKAEMDACHMEKIRISNAIYVINPGGYIGESTKREILFAESLGIPVNYMEPIGGA